MLTPGRGQSQGDNPSFISHGYTLLPDYPHFEGEEL